MGRERPGRRFRPVLNFVADTAGIVVDDLFFEMTAVSPDFGCTRGRFDPDGRGLGADCAAGRFAPDVFLAVADATVAVSMGGCGSGTGSGKT